MRKRSHITVVEGETPVADGSIGSSDDALVLDADDLEHQAEVWDEFEPAQRSIAWVAPAIALVAIATWSAFYIWANRAAMFAGGTPQQWSSWITAWAIPVLLVVSLWLLATRNSTREAARFGEGADRPGRPEEPGGPRERIPAEPSSRSPAPFARPP